MRELYSRLEGYLSQSSLIEAVFLTMAKACNTSIGTVSQSSLIEAVFLTDEHGVIDAVLKSLNPL